MTKSNESLPNITVDVVEDVTERMRPNDGFLRLRRYVLRNRRPDGTWSQNYRYDMVERDATDAVAIVLTKQIDGETAFCIRSSLRPPLAFRPTYDLPFHETTAHPVQWEVPAGLVETEEKGDAGLRACAARETAEEVGLVVESTQFKALFGAVALSPGVIAEHLHFYVADVTHAKQVAIEGDGSPVEDDAVVRFVTLTEARALIESGAIKDIKTELAYWRLLGLAGGR